MFEALNGYLFLHKSISIPGLGSICLEHVPASLDISNKQMMPPAYQFRFDKYFDAPDKDFFSYLANQYNVADFEAMRWYNEFAQHLREQIRQDGHAAWEGLGMLKRNEEGDVVFDSVISQPPYVQPVPAIQVIRKNTTHTIVVGDEERTNEEMNRWLSDSVQAPAQSRWWIWAIVAAVVAGLVILYHFSNHGWSLNSAGNQQLLHTDK